MRVSSALLLSGAVTLGAAQNFNRSSKRGLVFVPNDNTKYAYDNQVWVENNSDLTWYYNYGVTPSPAYANRSQSEFEFVPQLWSTGTTFYSDVKKLIDGGRNITHVLGYNEPDGTSATGGSNISPSVAATNWISQIEPLRALGVKTGAPAVTGAPSGLVWLKAFFAACTAQGTNCTADFYPAHWYDQYGLQSHITELLTTFGNSSKVWVTEFACASCSSLADAQTTFKSELTLLDSTNWVERYSWFGAFRSPWSNVGVNSAMLTGTGQLTSIGSWYLGGAATTNIPTDVKPSSGSRVVGSTWIAVVVGLVGLMILA